MRTFFAVAIAAGFAMAAAGTADAKKFMNPNDPLKHCRWSQEKCDAWKLRNGRADEVQNQGRGRRR